MQILDAGHPDIREFVRAKAIEERKAKALAAAGFGGGIDGEAHRSVAFQNSNLSVRVTDEFLRAARDGRAWTTRAVRTGEPMETFPARALLREIAQGAWECGDPGLQYDSAIQKWHTCPASGRIHASNPCSEFLFLDDTACNLASLNLLAYLRPDFTFDAAGFRRDAGTLFRAMEAIVDTSVYPTPRVAEMSSPAITDMSSPTWDDGDCGASRKRKSCVRTCSCRPSRKSVSCATLGASGVG